MIFDHLVKHNGVYYPKGTEVPIEKNIGGGEKAPAVDSGKVDDFSDEDKPLFTPEELEEMRVKKYSEEDLNQPYMKLVALAKKEGLKVERTTKAEELKEMLRKL